MADSTTSSSNPYLGQSNPYLQANIDNAQGDIIRNWNTAVQPAFNSAMVNSGSFGNAGVQQMNDNAALTTQKALGQVSDSMRMQDYNNQQQMYQWDQGFNRSLYNDAYSQNMNNLTTGVGLLGTLSGYNANDLTNANNIQNTPYNYWSNFANAANSLGQGFGTQTSTLGSTSNPLVSALGGAQLGNSLYNQYQAANGGGSYGSSPYSNYNSSNTQGYSNGDNYNYDAQTNL